MKDEENTKDAVGAAQGCPRLDRKAEDAVGAATCRPQSDRKTNTRGEIRHRWVWLAAVTVVGFLVDIGTKYLAVARLEERVPVPVIGDYFRWLLVYNKGAVFGTNPANLIPWIPANVLFIVFMVCAIAFLLVYYRMLKKDEVLMHVGLMLVLPGAFGNLHDRLVRPGKGEGVVDFIQMGIPPDHYWFIYNIADVFVTVGVGVMLLNFLLEAVRKPVPEHPGGV